MKKSSFFERKSGKELRGDLVERKGARVAEKGARVGGKARKLGERCGDGEECTGTAGMVGMAEVAEEGAGVG